MDTSINPPPISNFNDSSNAVVISATVKIHQFYCIFYIDMSRGTRREYVRFCLIYDLLENRHIHVTLTISTAAKGFKCHIVTF